MTALNTTPVFVESILRLASSVSIGGNRVVTADLRASYGGFILVRIGRQGTTAFDVGVGVRVNRLPQFVATGSSPLPYGNLPGTYIIEHPAPVPNGSFVTGIAAASMTTITVDAAAGDAYLVVGSTSGFSVGDLVTIGSGGSYDRWEVCRVRRIPSVGEFELEAGMLFAHTAAQADPVINKAECFLIPVDGGSIIELVIDHSASTTGENVDVEAFLQEYTGDVTQ